MTNEFENNRSEWTRPPLVPLLDVSDNFQSVLPPQAAETTLRPMSDISRDEMDAKIAASEARTDTKFARFEGKLDAIVTQLGNVRTDIDKISRDNERTRDMVRNYSIGVFFGIAGLIVAIAFGLPAVYGLGTSTRDIIQSEVQKATTAQPPTK